MMTRKGIFIIVAGLLIIGGTATIYAKTSANPEASVNTVAPVATATENQPVPLTTAPAVTETTTAAGDLPKTDNRGNYDPGQAGVSTTPVTGVPSDVSGLASLSAAFTAQEAPADNTITISCYLPGPARYTVQEKSMGAWKTTEENVFYAGIGGLDLGAIEAGQDAITLRVLQIENGQYIAITHEVTILRSDVMGSGGIKTYNV